MAKHFLFITFFTLLSGFAFSQTTKDKIDQLKKDPKTVENAAKADAGLIDKKNITDSTSKITATKKKRTDCKFKRKQSSIPSPK